jgi:AcrR family transcriptional regulator
MPPRIAPIYKRLPPGPHHLARGEVSRNQRIRMHGAMVEAVSQCGYEAATVRQVVALAGVSRRSFYEQFANKEACFLATFDMLAGHGMRRMATAYAAAGDALEDRLRAAFRELADLAATRRKGALLVLVEAQTAGPAAQLRLRRATATCERLLSRSFIDSPQASPLPGPVVRAIAGGLHASLSRQAGERGAARSSELAEEMLRWTLLFQTPAAERMARRVTERVVRRLRETDGDGRGARGQVDGEARNGHGAAPASGGDARERLLQNALRLAVLDDYSQLTAPQIAQEANVSIDAFFELFADKSECFLAALDMLAEELLAIAADPGLLSADWPQAVRRVIAELMRFLAGHPLYARTIAQEAFVAGPQATQRNLELAQGIATLLTEGAPGRVPSRLVVEGLAGAIWHTVRCHVAGARIQLLPALSDYLSYVALAPFVGADAAAEMVSEDRAP